VLGSVFFMLQFFVPMAAMFAVMPTMMTGWAVVQLEVSDAVLHDGEVHLVETTMSVSEPGRR
jgi:hypothetical protein